MYGYSSQRRNSQTNAKSLPSGIYPSRTLIQHFDPVVVPSPLENTLIKLAMAQLFIWNIIHWTNIALPPQRAYKSNLQKNAYPLKTPHVVGPQFVQKVMLVLHLPRRTASPGLFLPHCSSCHFTVEKYLKMFFDPVTLTFDIDLLTYIPKFRSVCLSVQGGTDTQCQKYYTRR